MSATRTYLDYLHENIDICPANSQEELDAAELIQDIMSAHELEVSQEDVSFAAWGNAIQHGLYVLMFLGVVLAGFIGTSMVYVGWGIALVAGILLLLEHKGIFKISQLGPRAQSQNVIAYHKGSGPLVMRGTRPIVVVAHYDTPHESILAQEQLAPYKARLLRLVPLSCICAFVCASFQLLHTLPFVSELLCRVVWLVGILSAIPLLACGIDAIYQVFSPCTEGANSNKSALASLLGIVDAVLPAQDAAKRWGEIERHHGFSEVTEQDSVQSVAESTGNEDSAEDHMTDEHNEEHINAQPVSMSTMSIASEDHTTGEISPEGDQEDESSENIDSTMSLKATEDTTLEALPEETSISHPSIDEEQKQGKPHEEVNDDERSNAISSQKLETPQTLELEYVLDVPEGIVRHGKETLEALHMLPQDCELIYHVAQKPLHPELLEHVSPMQEDVFGKSDENKPRVENHRNTPEFLSDENIHDIHDGGEEEPSEHSSHMPTTKKSRIRLSHASYDEDYPVAVWEVCEEPQKEDAQEEDEGTSTQTKQADPEKTAVYTLHNAPHREKEVLGDETPADSTAVIEDENAGETLSSTQHEDHTNNELKEVPTAHTADKQEDVEQADARDMARRAALFDLPSPLEIPSDPFATGAVLSSHEDEQSSQLSDGSEETPSFTRGAWKGGATPRQGLRIIEGGRARVEEDTHTEGEPEDTEDHVSAISLHNNPFVQEGVVELFQSPKGEDATPEEISASVENVSAPNAVEVLREATTNHPEVVEEASTQKDSETTNHEDTPTEEELQESVLSMGKDELLCHDIWFVTLGASAQQHAGMKVFLAEHRKDIRGAFLINLDGIGAGNLSILTHEGVGDTRTCDRRLRRGIKQVAQMLHIDLGEVKHDYASTDATEAMKTSMRSITLMGCDENNLCSLRGTADDVREALNPALAERVTNMVCELIRKS